jgi:hypothetical protein
MENNAKLAEQYNALEFNRGKIEEAKNFINFYTLPFLSRSSLEYNH